MLGPRSRTVKLLAEFGVAMEHEPRVRTPLGISGNADSPGEVALAVVSEIQSVIDHAFVGVRDRDEHAAHAEVA